MEAIGRSGGANGGCANYQRHSALCPEAAVSQVPDETIWPLAVHYIYLQLDLFQFRILRKVPRTNGEAISGQAEICPT